MFSIKVISTDSLYRYFDETLVPFIFPRYSVTGDLLNAYERLHVEDQINFRVGSLRLRQLRVKEGTVYIIVNRLFFLMTFLFALKKNTDASNTIILMLFEFDIQDR